MEKKGFIVYHDVRKQVSMLTDEQRGKLFMALLDYSQYGTEDVQLDFVTAVVFAGLQSDIDRDAHSYAEKCEINRENGKKGGRPRKNERTDEVEQTETPKPNGFFEKAKTPTQLNSTQSNSTQLNPTELNSTEPNSTQKNSNQINDEEVGSKLVGDKFTYINDQNKAPPLCPAPAPRRTK